MAFLSWWLLRLKNEYFQPFRTPLRFQSDHSECAIVSLSIILEYFGLWISLYDLRRLCGVSRDGTSAASIVTAARTLGLGTMALRLSFQDLTSAPMPCIVLWNHDHFLVLERITESEAYINDPNLGRRRVTSELFRSSYSHLSLHFRPSPSFKQQRRPRLLRRLIGTLKLPPLKSLLFSLASAIVAISIIDAAAPFVIKEALLTRPGLAGFTLRHMALIIIAAGLTRLLITAFQTYIQTHAWQSNAKQQSASTILHLTTLPISFFTSRSESDLITKAQAGEAIIGTMLDLFVPVLVGGLTVTAYVCISLKMSPFFGLIVLGLTLFTGGFFSLASRIRREWNIVSAQIVALRSRETHSAVHNMLMVKANGEELSAFYRWVGVHNRVARFDSQLQSHASLTQIIPSVITALAISVILIYYTFRVGPVLFGVTMAITLLTILGVLLSSISRIADTGDTIQQVNVAIERHEDIMLEPSFKLTLSTCSGYIGSPAPLLRLCDVSFSFGKSTVLSDVNLTLDRGDSLALSGPSGSGKSTLSALICGLIQPLKGEIYVSGKRLDQMAPFERAKAVLLVEQKPTIFIGSLRDNLTMFDAELSLSALDEVLNATGLTDLIARYPKGLDEMLYGSRSLSGGQAQRIHLARALLRNPALLILDEATNSVDEATEAAIFDFIHRRNMTIIVAAHRLSALAQCNRLVCLEKGGTVRSGFLSRTN